MIKTAAAMIAALKKGTFAGIILYEGPSLLDGQPIVAIANRIVTPSTNEKTGAIVQTFMLRADVHPVEATRTGQDESVCGACPARPVNGNYCYVVVAKSVAAVYRAYVAGRYARPGVDYDPAITGDLFEGSRFRIGSYGDGAAIPFAVWQACTGRAADVWGYTHQWRVVGPEFQACFMASCDTPEMAAEAEALGWRVFRTRLASEPKRVREAVCPASKEANYATTCETCKACGGLSSKARVSMTIIAHGAKAKAYEAWRMAAA